MKKTFIVFGIVAVLIMNGNEVFAGKQNPDCKALEQIFKTKVKAEKNVCSLEITRNSIEATHMGEKVSPETAGLSFHFAFKKLNDKETIVIGEMALLQEEVNPVIDELRKGGLEISAIHNHWMYEKPRIIYLHVQGKGNLIKQANTLINAIAVTKEQKKQALKTTGID
jgi:hypothetical protein